MSDAPEGPRRPSASSVQPKGILKNAPSRQVSMDASMQDTPLSPSAAEQHRLQWDEGNLALHDYEREQTTRMIIDEPKTPFVSSSNLAPDDVPSSFSLDSPGNSSGSSYFPGNGASASSSSGGSRRGSTASSAEVTARNTLANAQLGRRPSAGSSSGADTSSNGLGLMDGSAVENMQVDELEGGGNGSIGGPSSNGSGSNLQPASSRSRNNSISSRSPSFNLPHSDARDSVRSERAQGGDGSEEVEEEEEDAETKAKHAAFAAKRNQHYGNEAEAMRIAAALAAQDEEDDDEEGDEHVDESNGARDGVPPVPPLPRINGST
ncbi:hypothetical protein OC846_004193 [Tilletia horrida]|uniref:Protein phosphatase inhibitor 2 (IPP-2) n=1 Tax=Tilletia horrida TaxID=155126 RepID=A0AAN6GQ80_9BASI|nr:hypothetical protein OC846_004193 [Tilletia horrida]